MPCLYTKNPTNPTNNKHNIINPNTSLVLVTTTINSARSTIRPKINTAINMSINIVLRILMYLHIYNFLFIHFCLFTFVYSLLSINLPLLSYITKYSPSPH